MRALHTLGILSTIFMTNAFPTDLKEFPHMLSTCWLLFFNSIHTKPSQLCWGQVIVEARSSDAVLNHSPYWSKPLHRLGVCFGSLSCWKINDSPTKCKPDVMAYHWRMLWLPYWLPYWLPSHLLLHASRWEQHMQRSSVHLLCVSQRHGGLQKKNLKFEPKDRFPLLMLLGPSKSLLIIDVLWYWFLCSNSTMKAWFT